MYDTKIGKTPRGMHGAYQIYCVLRGTLASACGWCCALACLHFRPCCTTEMVEGVQTALQVIATSSTGITEHARAIRRRTLVPTLCGLRDGHARHRSSFPLRRGLSFSLNHVHILSKYTG